MLKTIFNYLMTSERYFAVVYPFIDKSIIDEKEYCILYDQIKIYTDKYSKQPDYDTIKLMLDNDADIDEDTTGKVIKTLNQIKKVPITKNLDFIIDESETWVRQQALKVAILESMPIIEQKGSHTQIYDKIKEAISIDFKNSLGMEYLFDCKNQYEYYVSDEEKFETYVEAINEALCGGVPRKTITSFIGRTNIGKTLVLCHMAADYIRKGRNVVYISGEMGETALYQRIDANIFEMNMQEFDKKLDEKRYFGKVKKMLKGSQPGRLFIKEYPTGTANKLHIQTYIRDLKLKKRDFVPDIIIIDYLNIFSSCRLPASQGADSYRYIKAITEEFRALAVEENVAIITATQTNRGGSEKSAQDSSMTDTSDSFGVPMTLDCMLAIIQSEEMAEQNKYILKVLKTRFGANVDKYYTIGVDKYKMTLYDVSEEEQEVPVAVKDKMDYYNSKRKDEEGLDSDGDKMTFVFDDELE